MAIPVISTRVLSDDLQDFVEMCAHYGVDAPIIRFGVQHIVRSNIVAQLVKMFVRNNI